MLKPIFTEKSLRLAKEGKYTFLVGWGMDKRKIKSEISKMFKVDVTNVRTIKIAGEAKRNFRGKKETIKVKKKAVVTLKDGQKLGIFEEKKK